MIGIRLDSGHGMNGYEWERYPLTYLPVQHNSDGIILKITRTGIHNPASVGNKVTLRNIYVDEKKIIPLIEEKSTGLEFNNGTLLFKQDGASTQLKIKPEHSLQLEFPVYNYAGKADVQIGEETTLIDLYGSNDERQWDGRNAKFINSWFVTKDGHFTITMPMPHYRVNTLRVESKTTFSLASATIITEDCKPIKLEGLEYHKGFNFPMSGIDKQLRRHFHPTRVLFQIIFALLTTWILSNLLEFAGRFHGLKDILINNHRYLFWSMLLFSCILFLFWHVSFWPGITSNDSLEIWRAAQIPGTFLSDSPPLNVIFYLYLSQFWNNVAIVPFAQNFLTSLLISYIFFSLFRIGLPIFCLLPFYLLTVFSLPVGLYTAILWKDIPFALIVVLVGFKLAVFYLKKQRMTLNISRREWLSLFLLILALAGFRYNGLLYFFIVPLILLLFGIARVRLFILGGYFFAVVFTASIFYSFPSGAKATSFLVDQTKVYLTQAINRLSFNYLEKCGSEYLGIFDVNQKEMQWDLVHLCAYGRYANDFLRSLRWNDVYPYLPLPSNLVVKKMEKAAWALYWGSYRVPWVYFSWNPMYMLLLFPVLPFLFKKFPMASVFSLYIFIPLIGLVFLDILNWRYYYFAYLGSYFLLPLLVTDYFVRINKNDPIL